MEINPNVFREYDVRGVVDEDLTHEFVNRFGLSCGTYFRSKGVKRISLGRDCRISSPRFRDIMVGALNEAGIDVMDLGVVPTPLLYFSLFKCDVDGGVMITASHNPPENNGFKICLHKMTIYGEEIKKLMHIMNSDTFSKGKGKLDFYDITPEYIDYCLSNINIKNPSLKVVVDAGNGTGGIVAVPLYRRAGFDVVDLFCEPDGTFPNHHPDPIVPDNIRDMIGKVKETGADLGVGLDGDADRIAIIDENGEIIWGDKLMILFARSILEKEKGGTFIAEVKCSQTLFDDIRRHGGRAIMWKVGHSLLKAKLKEENGLLAGEMSGHIFFSHRYLGYDDAIYAGLRLLEILSNTEGPLSAQLADLPSTYNTPEIRIDCPDEKKFQVVKHLTNEFKRDYEVIDVDGARVLFDGGWGLVRASNTQPVLVLRFEANSPRRLKEIQRLMEDKIVKAITDS